VFTVSNTVEDISEAAEFTEKDAMQAIKAVVKQHDVKMKNVMTPLRLALTGVVAGADMGKTVSLIGRARTAKRISCFLLVK
jgi:glutamyl/glutaminyl-tRNA synthetase